MGAGRFGGRDGGRLRGRREVVLAHIELEVDLGERLDRFDVVDVGLGEWIDLVRGVAADPAPRSAGPLGLWRWREPRYLRRVLMQDLGEISFPVWGTTATVLSTDAGRLSVAVAAVRAQLASFDVACSRFRNDSEIERVNGSAGRWVEVLPLLVDAVEVAIRAATLTDGDVDPTVGEALIVLGYDRDFAAVLPSGPSTLGPCAAPGWRLVEIDRTDSRIRVPIGVRLDLGATAKALAADRAAAAAAEITRCGVLVSLGGDIAVAGEAPMEGWIIGLAASHLGEPEPGQSVRIGIGGLATSSTTVRRWLRGGETLHHVVDPSTGRPAREVWRTVTVAATSCVDANTASTAAIVRGEVAIDWLASLGLPARLVRADGRIERTAAWPRPEVAA